MGEHGCETTFALLLSNRAELVNQNREHVLFPVDHLPERNQEPNTEGDYCDEDVRNQSNFLFLGQDRHSRRTALDLVPLRYELGNFSLKDLLALFDAEYSSLHPAFPLLAYAHERNACSFRLPCMGPELSAAA